MASRTERNVEREVLEWFHTTWDPDACSWNGELNCRFRWAVPSWAPQWHGLGLPAGRPSCPERFARLVVATPLGGGMSLAAPTIYDHVDELKSKYLRQTLTGELTWCQLFSEPARAQILFGCGAPQFAMETSG